MDELKPGTFSGSPAPAAKPGSRWGLGCLGVIAIIAAIAVISSLFNKPKEYDPNWSGEAISQCEDLVSGQLKAPATAKFNSTATGNGTWTVKGTVDSENSFGAMLRADYQCTVIIEGDSIKRRLDYLN